MYRPEEPGRPQRRAGQQPNLLIHHEGPGRRKGVANLRVQSVHRHRDWPYPAAVAPLQRRTRLFPQWPAAPLAKFSMRAIRGGVATAVTVLSTVPRSEGEDSGLDPAGTVSPGRTALSGSPAPAHSHSARSAAFFPTQSPLFPRVSRGQSSLTACQYPAKSPYRAGGRRFCGAPIEKPRVVCRP